MKSNAVVYTIMVGGYDNICQPQSISNKVDYVCFVEANNTCGKNIGIWRIEKIPFAHKDNGRLSRFPKLLPHETIISQYDYSLYIDANLIIMDSSIYDRVEELIEKGEKLALIKHPARDCAYQEAYNCIAGCKARWRDLFRQIFFLKRHKFPKHWGLYEANVIFRKHNDPEVKAMDELWWKTFMRFAKRDQLSLVYALRETGIHFDFFLPEGYSTLNHKGFERLEHLPQKDTKSVKFKKWLVSLIINRAKSRLKDPVKNKMIKNE